MDGCRTCRYRTYLRYGTQSMNCIYVCTVGISDAMNNKDRVPRLYKVAANVLADFTQGKDSIKNLVYQAR